MIDDIERVDLLLELRLTQVCVRMSDGTFLDSDDRALIQYVEDILAPMSLCLPENFAKFYELFASSWIAYIPKVRKLIKRIDSDQFEDILLPPTSELRLCMNLLNGFADHDTRMERYHNTKWHVYEDGINTLRNKKLITRMQTFLADQ